MLAMRFLQKLRGEEGLSAIEAAISCTVLFALLFGICQASLALYAYHVTGEAAREATRYAIVRGSTSCTNTPKLTNCNVTGAELKTYVQGLGFPGVTSSKLNAATSWYTASSTTPTTWSACSSGTCNVPGNLVKVTVTYPMSLHVPFANTLSLNLSNTSQMVISQ